MKTNQINQGGGKVRIFGGGFENDVYKNSPSLDELFSVEKIVTDIYRENKGLGKEGYSYVTDYISNYLVNSALSYQPTYTNPLYVPTPELNFDPIGAFYESTTATQDNSTSIADKTFRILGANNEAVSKEYLACFGRVVA